MSEKDNVRLIDRARETADKAKEAVSDQVGAARERFQDVAEDVGDRWHDVSANAREKIREKTETSRAVAREKYEATADKMRDGYSQVRKSTDELFEDVSDFVRDNPGKSVLIAAAAGFLLGLVFRGRRSDV